MCTAVQRVNRRFRKCEAMTRVTNTSNTVNGAVYEELKRSIITLRLAPGTEMSTQEIATKLNVSRTPVREAFLRLQNEDLVEMVPQKQTIVSRINLDRVEQERFLRESLEAAAIPLVLSRYTPDVVAKLKENIVEQKRARDAHDYALFIDHDNRFHKILFAAAGQALSWRVIISNNGHYNRLRTLSVQNDETITSAICQHERMVEQIKQQQADQLCAEFRDHVRKINREKQEFLKLYPDYFSTGNERYVGFTLGTL